MTPGVRRGAVAVATMVMVFFAVDLVAALWPIRPGLMQWRYGAGGFVSGSLVTVSFALLVFVAVTADTGLRVRQAMGSVLMLGALLLLATTGMFVLDALQLRRTVQPEMKTSFDATTARSVFKLLAGATVWTVLGVIAFRSGAPAASRSAERRQEGGLVVARPRSEPAATSVADA
jgi:hypothetical protein